MNVRRIIIEQDYELLATWWTRRNGSPPPLNMLPDTGVIAECPEGFPVACAFLYEISNAPIAIVEWEATNPDCSSPMKALRGLHMVFDFFEKYCKDKGFQFVITWVLPGRGDGRLLERRKWIKAPGEPHEMLAFVTNPKEELCQSLS